MDIVKKPVQQKYTIIGSLLILVLIGLFSIVPGMTIIRSNRHYMRKTSFEAATERLNKMFDSVFESAIKDSNALASVADAGSVDYAVLYDGSQTKSAHWGNIAGLELDPEKNEILRNFFTEKNIFVYPEFNEKRTRSAYLFSKTFYDDSENLSGMLLIKYNTADIFAVSKKQSDMQIMTIIKAMIAGVFVAVLLGFFLAYILADPVTALAEGTLIINDGNLDYEMDTRREDEFGYIAKSFSEMTKKVKAADLVLKEQKKLEDLFKFAKEMQEALYPEKVLSNDHFEIGGFSHAAKQIGGDYYHYEQIDENRFIFLLADVSGKGVPAAQVTFMIDIALTTIIKNSRNLDAGNVLTLINSLLTENMTRFGRFATVLLCVYNIPDNSLDYISAGHGELLVFRDEKKSFDVIDNKSIPIGLSEDTEYISEKIILNKNDAVLIFSDGVNEAWNEKKEEYGTDKLLDFYLQNNTLPVSEILSRIDHDINKFVGSAPVHDDMTLVVFRKK